MTTTHGRSVSGAVVVLTYIAGILATNLLSSTWPTVEFFALTMPAGTLAAGLVFTLRDLVDDTVGSRVSLAAVLVGTVLAGLTASPNIAAASAIAFAVSETVDALVYATLRARSRLLAMATSNLAGLTIDSLLFVPLAFGTLAAVPGQLVGKTVAGLASVGALAALAKTRVSAG